MSHKWWLEENVVYVWKKCQACSSFIDRHSWDWAGRCVWVQIESIDRLPWVKKGPFHEGRVQCPRGTGWSWAEEVTIELRIGGQCIKVYPEELWVERYVRCLVLPQGSTHPAG